MLRGEQEGGCQDRRARLEQDGEDGEGEEPRVVDAQLHVQQRLAPGLELEVDRGLPIAREARLGSIEWGGPFFVHTTHSQHLWLPIWGNPRPYSACRVICCTGTDRPMQDTPAPICKVAGTIAVP